MKTNHLVMGILAHVDAGKTTLSENILYRTGVIRKMGRVDDRNTFLDTDSIERDRGITIFSKQAVFPLNGFEITLVDTPGHADFSAETERVLSILDFALLLVPATEGMKGHTLTLWKLLRRYHVPTLVFINKTDMREADVPGVFAELKSRLSPGLALLDGTLPDADGVFPEAASEELAVLDDALTERYFEGIPVTRSDAARLFREEKLFPVLSGSALRDSGIEELLMFLSGILSEKEYPEAFSARVFKLTHDAKGALIAHMKVTGGTLRPKTAIRIPGAGEEKTDRILRFSGEGAVQVPEAGPGMVAAVTGLSGVRAGMTLGDAEKTPLPELLPLFSYDLVLEEEQDVHTAYEKVLRLSAEIPELSASFDEGTKTISVKLMGEVQTEVIRRILSERFGLSAGFVNGHIDYRETIAGPSEGAGHYEPLRHYAECHVLLEPLPAGSGMEICSACSEEMLARAYQNGILRVLSEYPHRGVLTGSELTDIRITLLGGRSHEKHTEGGDFREAALRAVRHALLNAVSVLLEPWYAFSLRVPQDAAGRAMNDLVRMDAEYEGPSIEDGSAVFQGSCAVSAMQSYQKEVAAYTKGTGELSVSFEGFRRCREAQEIVQRTGYLPEADLSNPCGSIFCTHGAGFYVPPEDVELYMHLPYFTPYGGRLRRVLSGLYGESAPEEEEAEASAPKPLTEAARKKQKRTDYLGAGLASDRELEAIFEKTFGNRRTPKENRPAGKELFKNRYADAAPGSVPVPAAKDEYLLVDGYNIIFAWEELKSLSDINIDSARERLLDLLSNYQGFRGMNLIAVFDAYKVRGNPGSVEKRGNIWVIYTKEAQTADEYIAKTVQEIGRKYHVTVATSDSLVQTIIFGAGAARMSAPELLREVHSASADIRDRFTEKSSRLENRMTF